MNRSWIFLGGASVLLALLLLSPPKQQSVARATRYSQIVDKLFINHVISLSTEEYGSADRSAQSADEAVPNNSLPKIVWSAPTDPQRATLADWYYRNSYLRTDIQRYNSPRSSDSRYLFSVEHGQLAHISPFSHVFQSLHPTRGRWVGRLLYASQHEPGVANLSLQSLDGRSSSAEILPLRHDFLTEEKASASAFNLFDADMSEPTPAAVTFFRYRNKNIAHVWRMGSGLLLKLDATEADGYVLIKIDGKTLRGREGAIYHLNRGSVLYFENHYQPPESRSKQAERRQRPRANARLQGSAWIVRDAADPDVIYDSKYQLLQAAGHDPLIPRLALALRQLGSGQGHDVADDVTLSLQRNAEEATDKILRDFMRGSQSVGAITLMDGRTGEVLALASSPSGPAASMLSQTSALRGLSAAASGPQNQNFRPLPVGSVAKIILGPAILDANPQLLKLQIEPLLKAMPAEKQVSFNSVVGLPLDPVVGEDKTDVTMTLDYRSGLKYSSNRFAISLLTLASRRDSNEQVDRTIADPKDYFFLNGEWQHARPPGLVFERDGPDDVNVQTLPWVLRMNHLFDLNASSVADSDRFTRRYVWDNLPQQLQPSLARELALLDGISPEYENLRLEGIERKDYRTKFVSLILGAGESRWSNVELAEVAATLLQNNAVRATFLARLPGRRDVGPSLQHRQPFYPLKESVRQKLADAMKEVFDAGGTGYMKAKEPDAARRKLSQAARAKHEVFSLVGKTGTPQLSQRHESAQAFVFNMMARDHVFRLGQEGRILYTGFRSTETMEGRAITTADLPYLQQLRNLPQGPVAEHFNKYFAHPTTDLREAMRICRIRSVATLWDKVMQTVATDNETPDFPQIQREDATLNDSGTCPVQDKKESDFGRHIVLIAATYPQEAVLHDNEHDATEPIPYIDVNKYPPKRAIVAVVAVADPSLHKEVLPVVAKLLNGPIARYLELDVPQPEQDRLPNNRPQKNPPRKRKP